MTTATADFPTQAALNEQTRVIYQQVCKNQAEDHQKAISALVEQHGKAMIENRTHYEALLKEQRNENLVTLKGLRKDHEEELKKLKKDHEEEFKNLKNDHEEELKSLNDDHKKELKQKDEECEHKNKKAKKDSKFIEEVMNQRKDHFNQWDRKNHQKFVDSGCDNQQVIDTLAKNVSKSNYMTGDIGEDTCRLLLLKGWTERTLCTQCAHVQSTMPLVEAQIVREETVDM